MRIYLAISTDLPMKEIRRRLSWVDFLAPLSEDELQDLLQRTGFLELEEGKMLVVGPEEHAQGMVLLVAGQLQVYEVSLNSNRGHTLSVLSDGTVVGATGLVPRWTRALHIRALEPSLVCRIEQEDLEVLVRGNPEGGLGLACALANQLQLMEDRWADMVEKDVSSRPAGLLYMLVESVSIMSKDDPMISTRYTYQQLGSMIGSNREAVTRVFAELQEGGTIEVRKRRIYVKDFDALRRNADEYYRRTSEMNPRMCSGE